MKATLAGSPLHLAECHPVKAAEGTKPSVSLSEQDFPSEMVLVLTVGRGQG